MSEKNSDEKPANPEPKKPVRKSGVKGPGDKKITLRGEEIPQLQRKTPNRQSDRVRLEAMYVYVTNLDGCTVSALREDPRFAHIAERTLLWWAREDNWTRLRKETLDRVKLKIQKQLEVSMTGALRAELGHLDNIISESHLQLSRVAPRSWEAVAKVMMMAMERKDQLTNRMAAEQVNGVTATHPEGKLPEAIHDENFRSEDFREAAKLILQKRMSRLNAGDAVEAAQDAPDENKPKPEGAE